MPITKDLTVLAVHGDVDETAVQSFIDSQHKLNSDLPENRGKTLEKAVAKCNGLIVASITATDSAQEEGRVEIPVTDFAQMTGIKAGSKLRMTLEVVL